MDRIAYASLSRTPSTHMSQSENVPNSCQLLFLVALLYMFLPCSPFLCFISINETQQPMQTRQKPDSDPFMQVWRKHTSHGHVTETSDPRIEANPSIILLAMRHLYPSLSPVLLFPATSSLLIHRNVIAGPQVMRGQLTNSFSLSIRQRDFSLRSFITQL